MPAPGIEGKVTRLVNGITNVADNNIMADHGQPDPTKFISLWEDFMQNPVAADYTITAIGTGTNALGDVNGGALVVTTSGASGDSRYLQRIGRSILMTPGKKAFFKARVKVDLVATSTLLFGLQNSTTTPKVATDGIYFLKSSAATVDVFVRKDTTTGSNTVAAVATMVNDTFMEFGLYFDGVDRVFYSIDGVVKGSLLASAAFLPDAQLSISFGAETNVAVARVGTFDYLYMAMER